MPAFTKLQLKKPVSAKARILSKRIAAGLRSVGAGPRQGRGPRKSGLKLDPTRTFSLRKAITRELKKVFARLRFAIRQKVVIDDVFGLAQDERHKVFPTGNAADWQFMPNQEKVEQFKSWLKQQFQKELKNKAINDIWLRYAEEGFRKGAGRAFDDTNRVEKALGTDGTKLDFYEGTREQFLKSSFAQPANVEAIKVLAGRSFNDLEGISDDMSTKMTRTLSDGLVQGKSPREIGADLDDQLDLGQSRSETIARTEIIRAHAEGQLAAFEALGVDELGVAVEWSTADDELVCPLCAELEGIVIPVAEAHGMLPRHPNCRCAWIPADVGEAQDGQKRGKEAQDAIDAAGDLNAESDLEGNAADLRLISNVVQYNVFCPTGPGGGVDPTCSPGGSSRRVTSIIPLYSIQTDLPRLTETEKKEYKSLFKEQQALFKKIKSGSASQADKDRSAKLKEELNRLSAVGKSRAGHIPVQPKVPAPTPAPTPPAPSPVTPAPAPTPPASATPANPEPAPANPSRALRDQKAHVVETRFHRSIDEQSHLSPEEKAQFKAGITRALRDMPIKALSLVSRNVKNYFWGRNVDEMNTQYAKISNTDTRGRGIRGWFSYGTNTIALDGLVQKESAPGFEGDTYNVHGTYAHEMGHAIDFNFKLSSQKSWMSAWIKEIGDARGLSWGSRPTNRLTAYAQTAPYEGFAEFSRLVYGSKVDKQTIEKKFPKCSAFFKRKGLWPD